MNASSRSATFIVLMLTLGLAACSPGNREQPNLQPEAGSTVKAAVPVGKPAAAQVSGERALQYVKEVVSFGPRPVGSAAHARVEAYLRQQLKGDGLEVEEDSFLARANGKSTRFRNFIAKLPGTKDGIVVAAGHYDTKPIKDFVGANDGGSSAGLLLELAQQLRGGKREGYSVWLVWLDGEEAMQVSGEMDWNNSLYGSRHLAERWQKDGTIKRVKAFLLLDMIGDADLHVERETNSTPWLLDVVYQAASRMGYQSHFFQRSMELFDDHMPFARLGVPVADLIDFDYGPANSYWHTPQDSTDKLSARSLEIVGNTVLEAIRMLDGM